MSQCVSCANQPNDNDSLGGAAHEGTVTPMVIGIIVGTVAVFILVVCTLFYCVKLENTKYMTTKIGDGGGEQRRDRELSVKSRPSSVTVVPSSGDGGGGYDADGETPRSGAVPVVNGGKRRLFGWVRKGEAGGKSFSWTL